MPLYDLKCTSCEETLDNAVLSYEDMKAAVCYCGAPMEVYHKKVAKGVNNMMKAKKGPLETYKDGDNKCFYTNQLMLSAQEKYL